MVGLVILPIVLLDEGLQLNVLLVLDLGLGGLGLGSLGLVDGEKRTRANLVQLLPGRRWSAPVALASDTSRGSSRSLSLGGHGSDSDSGASLALAGRTGLDDGLSNSLSSLNSGDSLGTRGTLTLASSGRGTGTSLISGTSLSRVETFLGKKLPGGLNSLGHTLRPVVANGENVRHVVRRLWRGRRDKKMQMGTKKKQILRVRYARKGVRLRRVSSYLPHGLAAPLIAHGGGHLVNELPVVVD